MFAGEPVRRRATPVPRADREPRARPGGRRRRNRRYLGLSTSGMKRSVAPCDGCAHAARLHGRAARVGYGVVSAFFSSRHVSAHAPTETRNRARAVHFAGVVSPKKPRAAETIAAAAAATATNM